MPFHPLGFLWDFFRYTFETRIFYALKSLNPLITLLWEREHNCFCSHMDCLILLLYVPTTKLFAKWEWSADSKLFLASLSMYCRENDAEYYCHFLRCLQGNSNFLCVLILFQAEERSLNFLSVSYLAFELSIAITNNLFYSKCHSTEDLKQTLHTKNEEKIISEIKCFANVWMEKRCTYLVGKSNFQTWRICQEKRNLRHQPKTKQLTWRRPTNTNS